ncbi:hypothetical protein [Actinocrispum wychmicini]|uniref:DNA-directed RNA polymerase specialized sigma24 family protein n=1 Tax=Actinocrispum wychmicini TaxID=1213861 RepID=A0A4R2JEZ9_9PSEU|nr:hypothetical protein [Actinocrispum wychmicini]TCO58283.1 hypothetical protein EV192_105348 [Actinocrispum wychmicini]
MPERQRSCLDLTEEQFHLLSRGSRPVTVDGRLISRELPARRVGLQELRVTMLKRRAGDRLTDAVWSHLVRMAGTEPDPWVIAAAGMMLPGLKSIAARMRGCYPYDTCDLDSEILEAFLHELRRLAPDRPGLHIQLYQAAWRRGWQTCRREARRASRCVPLPEGLADHRSGNPDIPLARALLDGVITAEQATLVCRVHLDSAQRGDVARQLGMGRDRARRELAIATRGLSVYLAAA